MLFFFCPPSHHRLSIIDCWSQNFSLFFGKFLFFLLSSIYFFWKSCVLVSFCEIHGLVRVRLCNPYLRKKKRAMWTDAIQRRRKIFVLNKHAHSISMNWGDKTVEAQKIAMRKDWRTVKTDQILLIEFCLFVCLSW